MEVSTEMSKMIEVIKKYDDQLRKGNDAYKYYFAPNIPEKVMKGLVSHFDNNLPFNSVIAYYDTTVFNSSKAGFVFTDDGLYYKYMGKPYYFAYKDMAGFEIKGKKLCIRFSDEKIPEYVMDDVFDMKALNSILSELKEIDDEYGQLTEKSTGKVKKLELPSVVSYVLTNVSLELYASIINLVIVLISVASHVRLTLPFSATNVTLTLLITGGSSSSKVSSLSTRILILPKLVLPSSVTKTRLTDCWLVAKVTPLFLSI